MKTRTENSIKNILYTSFGQVFAIIISLIARFCFVKVLTSEYLGLNGLFSNVLSVLSLMDLGIGPAMAYSLYKPLANNDNEQIKAIMNVYKKFYIIIGCLILLVGVCLIPILPNLISTDTSVVENLNTIYILFLLNSGVSYFFSYKKTLLTSDQKNYIVASYHYVVYFLLNLSQIIVLFATKNYILFLILQIISTLTENILISQKVDKMYPYLNEKNVEKLNPKIKKEITKNVRAMTMHKIGSIVVTATDNLIISKYVGLVAVGLYSNYYLITSNLKKIITQIFDSLIASVGNLSTTKNEEKMYDVFQKTFFINFLIYSFCSICLIVLFNDFIVLWVGKNYLFDILTVLVIVANFYVTGMRKTVLLFRDALGLYWYDRYKPFFEAVINLVTSIFLSIHLGVIGVFLGTLISTMTTCFWVEPLVLYKHGLHRKFTNYLKVYVNYLSCTIGIGSLTYLIANIFDFNIYISFIYKMVICLIIPTSCYYILFRKTENFNYIQALIIKIISKFVKRGAHK